MQFYLHNNARQASACLEHDGHITEAHHGGPCCDNQNPDIHGTECKCSYLLSSKSNVVMEDLGGKAH